MQNVSSNGSSAFMAYYAKVQLQSIYLKGIVNEFAVQVQLTVGVISLLCTICIISTIFISKSLRKKNYFLIAGVACGDAILELIFLYNGVMQRVTYLAKRPTVWNQLQCVLEDSPRLAAAPLSKGFFCLCSIDRFLAIYKPHWYNTSYPRWLFPLMVFVCVFNACFDVVLCALGASPDILIPLCVSLTASSETMLMIISAKNTTVLSLGVVLYIVTIGLVYIRLDKVKKQNGNVNQARKEMQTKVVFSLALMMGSYVVTVAVTTVTYKFLLTKPVDYQVRMGGLLVNFFLQISPIFDVMILIWRNKDFRIAFVNIFCFWKKNKISNATSTGYATERGTRTIIVNPRQHRTIRGYMTNVGN